MKLFAPACAFTAGAFVGFIGFGQWFLSNQSNSVSFLSNELSQCRLQQHELLLNFREILSSIAVETSEAAKAVSVCRKKVIGRLNVGFAGSAKIVDARFQRGTNRNHDWFAGGGSSRLGDTIFANPSVGDGME